MIFWALFGVILTWAGGDEHKGILIAIGLPLTVFSLLLLYARPRRRHGFCSGVGCPGCRGKGWVPRLGSRPLHVLVKSKFWKKGNL